MSDVRSLERVRAELSIVLEELSVRRVGFDKGWSNPGFLANEWDWRSDRTGFAAWLAAPEPDLSQDWTKWFKSPDKKTDEFSWQNSDYLRKTWKASEAERKRAAFDALRLATELRRGSDDADRRKVVEAYFRALDELSKTDGLEKRARSAVASEYHIRSVPLSAAAPSLFPFVFSSLLIGAVTKRVLGDFGQDPARTADGYLGISAAFATLADALELEFGQVDPNARVRMAAAWLVEANRRWGEPKRLATSLLREGWHVILQGPPGTGKTWVAEQVRRELASRGDDGESREVVSLATWRSMAQNDRSAVGLVHEFVQFHASYDYEDFVRGFRPRKANDGLAFELEDGPFAAIVSEAIDARATHPEVRFLLTIDEINRADLARVLGECVYLLDRRTNDTDTSDVEAGRKPGAVRLRYVPGDGHAGRPILWVPSNLYVLGTMNTADRSTAIVDNALRRRFLFVDVPPSTEVIRDVWTKREGRVPEEIERYIAVLDRLNGVDDDTKALIRDPRYRVGHSFFLGTISEVRRAMQYQVIPLLREYDEAKRLLTVDDYGLRDVERDLLERA